MTLIDSWIVEDQEKPKLKSGFSFQKNLISTKLYKHLEPHFDNYLDQNGFLLGRHLKVISKKIEYDVEDIKYSIFINTIKEDQKFENFKNSLKSIINNFANIEGYRDVENEKSFNYIFFEICNMYAVSIWKEDTEEQKLVITKGEFGKIIGYDIFPDLANNARVYLSKNFESCSWNRKEKIKRLLS